MVASPATPTTVPSATSARTAPARYAGLKLATATDARGTLLRTARHLCAAARALTRAWRLNRRAAADRRSLQAMSTQELTDLGLGRGEIAHLCGRAASDRPRDPWRHP